jgi:hypothetical protein
MVPEDGESALDVVPFTQALIHQAAQSAAARDAGALRSVRLDEVARTRRPPRIREHG